MTRQTSRKESFVCNCWFVAMMTNKHAFGMAHLSELTHCMARIYITSFEQCKQIRATLAQRSLCGVAPARQETDVFPTGKRATKKKKETRKRGRKNISFTADSKFRAKESTISEPKSLRPFPFLCTFFEHVEASMSPGWALPCVCTLTSSACAGRHLDIFGCQKQTWKRHSRLTILSGIVPTIVGEDAKHNGGFPRPSSRRRRSGGDEGLGSRLVRLWC